ncbi:O-antigen ligase family protein, partial [Caenispirillum bisanense]|uniref:O-antigen ligase family protein n=1 Tax=Caenispirillum bisanense TaxID=414052 RepID=UPI0031D767DD
QSRAGIVAAAAGLLVTAGRLWRPRPAVAAAAVAALAAAIVLSPVGARLGLAAADAAANPRLTVWATTLEGIADAPLTGIGLGAFPDAFAERRPRALLHPWAQAHNVYLELAWELGLPATAALLAALALIGWRLLRSPSATAAAGLGALTAAALHALADFSPQVPASALLLATLVGAGCGRAGAAR